MRRHSCAHLFPCTPLPEHPAPEGSKYVHVCDPEASQDEAVARIGLGAVASIGKEGGRSCLAFVP